MRRAARIDGNHRLIVRQLRSIPGCTVADTSALGNGFPDLVVGFQGRTILIEVKDGRLKPSARRLTEAEHRFHEAWTGGRLVIAENADQAVIAVLDKTPQSNRKG